MTAKREELEALRKHQAVVDAARSWASEVLKCRLLGHNWDQDGRARHYAVNRYWLVGFICTRQCGVSKWEEWDERGLVIRKGMHYPRDESSGEPTYLLEGFGRINADDRGALRLETIGRTKPIEIEQGQED